MEAAEKKGKKMSFFESVNYKTIEKKILPSFRNQ
jgi:hypothetical protein